MMFTIVLAGVFIGSAATLWYRISQKIPELVAIPDEVIVERLYEDSARIRVFLLSWRRYWQEREHWQLFWRISEKVLHRLHIWMLRADNGMMNLLKKVRMAGGLPNGNWNGGQSQPADPERVKPVARSFKSARPVRGEHSLGHGIVSEGASHGARIQEVRRKRVKSAVPE